MDNQFDIGMQQDFDNMTDDLSFGNVVVVYPRDNSLAYEGFEGTASGLGTGVSETCFVQELNQTNEAVAAGILNVGDVRITFKADTIAEEEGYVITNGRSYKLIAITKVIGQTNSEIIYVLGYGKKVPNR